MSTNNLKRSIALSVLLSASAISMTTTENNKISAKNLNIIDAYAPVLSDIKINSFSYDAENSFDLYSEYLPAVFKNQPSLIRKENGLDSLINQAKDFLDIALIHNTDYINSTINKKIDKVLTRPKINQEELVDKILDTLTIDSKVIDKYFIKASIQEESQYDPKISSAKAKGLMQFIPVTWKEFGEGSYKNVTNPEKNIKAGVKYYLWLENFISERYHNWDKLSIDKKRNLLSAAYNGGHNRLQNRFFNVRYMPKESRDHVVKINNTMKVLRAEDLFKELALYRENIEFY
jgi:hypothetical protein